MADTPRAERFGVLPALNEEELVELEAAVESRLRLFLVRLAAAGPEEVDAEEARHCEVLRSLSTAVAEALMDVRRV